MGETWELQTIQYVCEVGSHRFFQGGRVCGTFSYPIVKIVNSVQIIFFNGATALVRKGLLHVDAPRSHSDTSHLAGPLGTRDHPETEELLLLLFTAVGLLPSGSGYFTCTQNMKLVTTKFKSGGLYEMHVVAIWNLRNHLSICF